MLSLQEVLFSPKLPNDIIEANKTDRGSAKGTQFADA